jgi:transposase-like protein
MRGPKPSPITLSAAERQALERLVRRHSTPQQVALRAQLVLAAADGADNCQIARQFDVSLDMVRRWRALVSLPSGLPGGPAGGRSPDRRTASWHPGPHHRRAGR